MEDGGGVELLQKMNVKLTMRIFTEAEEGCLHF